MQLPDFVGDLRDELNGAGRDANNPDPLSTQIMLVIPARGMKVGPLEILDARNLGPHQIVKHAQRAHDHVRLDLLTRVGDHFPARLLVLPAGGSHGGLELNMAPDVVFVRAMIEVGENLGLPSEGA